MSYPTAAVKTFADKLTLALFSGEPVRSVAADLRRQAWMKLGLVDGAVRLEDLRIPPSNNLEVLRGKRKGQHSIRVNKQWRICFRWEGGDAYDVEFTDYH
jgi:proteic killer suppression protein